jgi:hypothetical protein
LGHDHVPNCVSHIFATEFGENEQKSPQFSVKKKKKKERELKNTESENQTQPLRPIICTPGHKVQ